MLHIAFDPDGLAKDLRILPKEDARGAHNRMGNLKSAG